MTKYRNLTGALLATLTALCWGGLPVAMKTLVGTVDPATLVWIRFTTAALGVWLWLAPSTHRPAPEYLSWRFIVLLSAATLGLAGNFVLFNASVEYLSAPASQIVGLVGPSLLIVGSVLVLHEPVSRMQKIGFIILFSGLFMFFNQHLHELIRFEGAYFYGILLGVCGASGWAMYGLINKYLLRDLRPLEIMRVIYTGSAILLFPMATPSQLLNLTPLQMFSVFFCCANTLVAYGAFTEALARWDTSKVSALTTTTPLFSLTISEIAWMFWPETFPTEQLNLLGFFGVFVVVGGAVLTAVGKAQKPHKA